MSTPSQQQQQQHRSSINSSSRHETFTEAVPLALSSMAHASVFADDAGVLDGIRQVIQHTLWQCVNYARMAVPTPPHHDWTVRDLRMSRYGWRPVKEGTTGSSSSNSSSSSSNSQSSLDHEIPIPLVKLQFQHSYSRNALISLKPAAAGPQTHDDIADPPLPADQQEVARLRNWTKHSDILGRITLLYATTEPLTQGEMDGTERDDDMPACILYKVLVEYRTLPPTGNLQATLAEELSMLSFGGSVDDDVKYGALASLYDEHAKYVLEIYGVRGRKYKFDLMDSTLSDGTIPTLPASRDGDPFVKSLCVTVTDHELYKATLADDCVSCTERVKKAEQVQEQQSPEVGTNKPSEPAVVDTKPRFAITRMSLLLEGKPRRGNEFSKLPTFDDIVNGIADSFLLLNPNPPIMVTAVPSGHALLLDPKLAGRIYVNGRYVTTWGSDARIGSHGIALFGMDLHSIPLWHGRIVDYEALKAAYAVLWDDVLVDARLAPLDIAARLLFRLFLGRDRDEDEELYDDESMQEDSTGAINVNVDCLESQVLSSTMFDPVGIAAKALATTFAIEFGKDAFPCAAHEIQWVQKVMPERRPMATPQRLIKVLRRGGYFDTQFTVDELWLTNARPPNKGVEQELINDALQLLEQAGCGDVAFEQINMTTFALSGDVVLKKMVCHYHPPEQTYYIHEKLLDIAVNDFVDNENQAAMDSAKVKAFLLGMFIAKEHPDGRVLPRYMSRVNL